MPRNEEEVALERARQKPTNADVALQIFVLCPPRRFGQLSSTLTFRLIAVCDTSSGFAVFSTSCGDIKKTTHLLAKNHSANKVAVQVFR